MPVVIESILVGMLALVVATVPRNILFVANLQYLRSVPWAVPLVAAYLWLFWRYLGGWGPPDESKEKRRRRLRANALPGRVWAWALVAGTLGIVTLVVLLRVANRLARLPDQAAPDLSGIPTFTLLMLLLMSSLFAGVVEEASFRGYMQGPIEGRHGTVVAIVITGVMFAVAHLDFAPVLLPYYVAVAAIYGAATHLTNSILPAVVLHTGGNIYSNTDLWLHGRSDWQAPAGGGALVWQSGADAAFWTSLGAGVVLTAVTIAAYVLLARSVKSEGAA